MFMLTIPGTAQARAEKAIDETPAFVRLIDAGAGHVVSALDAVLFFPVNKTTVVEPNVAPVTDVATAQAAIEALASSSGEELSEMKLTFTVPSASVSEEDAEALARTLEQALEPKGPSGTRSLAVERSDSGDGYALAASDGGIPFVALWLFLGAVFFTLRMGFINFRAFWHAIEVTRGKFDNPDDEGEVSHFQALASALSATVGLGNIAGVAIAVAVGGPGAVFWLIAAGLLGMSSKFVECTLGQKYRERRPDGSVLGGPIQYLSKGLAEKRMPRLGKVLAVMFAILCVGGSLGGGNTFQVNQSLGVLKEQVPLFAEHGWLYGLVMVVAVGIVIVGGIKRIAGTAEKIVPLMCGVYVLACLYILGNHLGDVPAAFGRIVGEAFTPAAGYGGFLGVLVTGIRRAAFSNEAGVGSAAIAHSAARTEYPVREGIVALLEPFIDTVIVCTMTGLVIVITGAFENPANFELIASSNGAALTSRAMASEISWFPYILMVAVVLFAYSTMISWSYYGERCWVWMFGDGSSKYYKVLFLVFVFLGSVVTATNILNFGDYMILSMAFPNILGVFILSGTVKKDLTEYMGNLKAGKFKRYE